MQLKYKRCHICCGLKHIVGMGGMRTDCYLCNGTGVITDDECSYIDHDSIANNADSGRGIGMEIGIMRTKKEKNKKMYKKPELIL